MATFYRGLRSARPPRIAVVDHELLRELPGRPPNLRWHLTLACSHTRVVTAGRRCPPGTFGVQIIHGEPFVGVPKSLNCAACVPLV